ncbi:MAG: pseudouridine-5'-phosphate glycosidase [Phycisphaerales bacterium]
MPPHAANALRPRVALETTLLLHGVPRDSSLQLFRDLAAAVREGSAGIAEPAVIGVKAGQPIIGMTEHQFMGLLEPNPRSRASGAPGSPAPSEHRSAGGATPKLNTANLGVALHRHLDGATTVSTTLELAAAAGIRVFATGGLGGVHRNFHSLLDISPDLAALTRFPVAVVCSGVKSILDIASTREALETLGIPVIGFQTDVFPAFYLHSSPPPASPLAVDARFDDPADLARFAARELARTRRAVVIANPVPREHELSPADWTRWVSQAMSDADAAGVTGRDVTPFVLSRLHDLSMGATLHANIELVKSNARLAGRLAKEMATAIPATH